MKLSQTSIGVVLMRDMNARFGNMVKELPVRLDLDYLSYPCLPDPVQVPSGNASALFGMCVEEELMVVNKLQCCDQRFSSKLTYRHRRPGFLSWTVVLHLLR